MDIIEDNYFEGNTSGSWGGAMVVLSTNGPVQNPDGPPSAVVNRNTFHDNHAAEYGGAILVLGLEVTMDDNIYTHNSAQVAGGAIGFLDIVSLLASVFGADEPATPVVATVSNSHFADNWVEGMEDHPKIDSFFNPVAELHVAPGGGAFSIDFGADITFDNSSLEENSARMGDGGGIKNGGSFGIDDPFGFFGGPNNVGSTDLLTVANSTFEDNEATTGNGGAISSGGVPDPAFEDATTFDSFKDEYESNTAGGNGGALYLRKATGDIEEGEFEDNEAGGLGNSIYMEASSVGLKDIDIDDEDADDIVIVPGASPTATGVSGPLGALRAVESGVAPPMSLDGVARRWRFRLLRCVDDVRQLSRETGTLECSIDGSGR